MEQHLDDADHPEEDHFLTRSLPSVTDHVPLTSSPTAVERYLEARDIEELIRRRLDPNAKLSAR
jgi:hypothetical protein